LRVLVVDDNATNRRILEMELGSWGMKPVLVPSAERALSALRSRVGTNEAFEVIILDGHMPDKDGYELAEEIASDPAFDKVRFVLLTSAMESKRLSERANERVLASLTKPARQSLIRQALAFASGAPTARVRPGRTRDGSNARRATAAASGAGRILVAEDNQTNQRVTALMAEKLGYEVDIASTGAEAVEAVTRVAYDVVLMDCQMPELDGFEATRRIRSMGFKDLPIVAMTASVVLGVEQRCADAGMNDYMSKPVSMSGLEAMLTKVKTEKVSSTPEGEPSSDHASQDGAPEEQATQTDPNEAIVDKERLASLMELHGNDQDKFYELMESFVQNTQGRIEALTTDVEAGDGDVVGRSLHAIVGSSSTFAAPRLAVVARELETYARNGDLENVSLHMDDLVAAFTDVRNALLTRS